MVHRENVGAFMGLGASLPPVVRTLAFGVFAALLLILVSLYLLTARDLSGFEVVSMSLLVAGGVGNLIDRVTRQGAVTDFVILGFGLVRTGVFNLADLVIVVGTVGVVVAFWRTVQRWDNQPDRE